MGAIHYYEKERVFKLDTPHTSYLIGIVDEEKFLDISITAQRSRTMTSVR